MKNRDIIQYFNQWKNDSRLHNEILAAGCMERTRIICQDLIDKGIKCGYLYIPKEEQKDEVVSCTAQLKSRKNYCFHWMRHVVPYVFDEEGNKVILDVCLMNGPEKLEDWAKHIHVQDHPLTQEDFYDNPSEFLYALEFRSKNKDPWIALESFSHTFKKFPIVPNQVSSKWLEKHQKKSLFLKKERSR